MPIFLSVRPSSFLFLAYEKLYKSTDAIYRCTEDYETALEKRESLLAAENASDRLIREYEQKMGTVMSNPRSRAVRPSLPSIVFRVLLNGADKKNIYRETYNILGNEAHTNV